MCHMSFLPLFPKEVISFKENGSMEANYFINLCTHKSEKVSYFKQNGKIRHVS